MNKILFVIPVLAAVLFMASCKDDDNDMAGKGEMKVYLTDAPALYDAVNVDVQAVEVHTETQGWVSLNVNPGVYNLLDYANGNDTLIASSALDVGRVSQIRLILGANNSIVVAGTSFPLQTPSAQQSGLKLNVQADIEPGVTYEMTLDFDASRSIVVTGNSSYILKPVIRVISAGVDGAISGTISPAAFGTTVYAASATDTAGTIVSASGYFLIGGLAAGNYDLMIDAPLPYNDTTINNVTVNTGLTTDLNVVALP